MINSYYNRVTESLNNKRYSNYHARSGNAHGGLISNPMAGLESANRVISLKAANTTDVSATAVLFGFGREGDGASAGSGTGIAITGQGAVQHGEAKRLTISEKLQIKSLKLKTTDANQFDESIQISYRGSRNKEVNYEIFPDNYKEQVDNDPLRVRIPDFNGIVIDAATRFVITIQAGVSLTFVFTFGAIVETSEAFTDDYVVQVNTQPAPTGMPAQELIIAGARG